MSTTSIQKHQRQKDYTATTENYLRSAGLKAVQVRDQTGTFRRHLATEQECKTMARKNVTFRYNDPDADSRA